MNIIQQAKIENYLKQYEKASAVVWGDDSCTTLDEKGNPLEDYMIDIEDGEIQITPVENNGVTITI